MSDAGSETKPGEETRFVESSDRPTMLGYGDGGVPFYIGVVWVAVMVAYIAIMLSLALPDFLAWARS